MSNYVYVIVIVGAMVEELFRFKRADVSQAEKYFVNQMEQRLSNFDEYTQADIDACIEDGYEGFGELNSIQIHWSDE